MKLHEAVENMKSVIRRKHLSLSTEETYLGWLKKYCIAVSGWKSPPDSPEGKMEWFLTDLAKRGVSASTQNQAFNAILFFYREVLRVELGEIQSLRARAPKRMRHAPSVADVRALLGEVRDVHNYRTSLLVRLLYGCGLRVSEACSLRIKDVDLDRSRLVVREAKGNKDRMVAMPCSVVEDLREQMRVASRFFELDKVGRVPVGLPGLLSKKYRSAAFSWQWYWVFPSQKPCLHPRTGERLRWHVHPANVQKCVREAAARLGLEGVVTPHCLRHSYATHLLDRGANIKGVAAAMGHVSIETTAGYVHSTSLSVGSPLEAIL